MNNLPMIANRVEEKIQDVQLVIQNRELRIFKTGTKEAMPKVTEVLSQLLPCMALRRSPNT
jgi:predicted metal-dependent hydrolase